MMTWVREAWRRLNAQPGRADDVSPLGQASAWTELRRDDAVALHYTIREAQLHLEDTVGCMCDDETGEGGCLTCRLRGHGDAIADALWGVAEGED